jgi:hypothetical protein
MNSIPFIENELSRIAQSPDYKHLTRHYQYCDEIDEATKLLFVGCFPLSINENTKTISHYSATQIALQKKSIKRFYDFSENWNYINLLYIDKSKEKLLLEIVKKGKTIERSFILEQLRLTKEVIGFINPSAIIICDKLSESIISNERFNGSRLEFDDEIGTHTWRNVPTFISNFYSLDKASYERLKWHVNKTIAQKNRGSIKTFNVSESY